MPQQEIRDVFGAIERSLQADRCAVTALRQFAFDGAQQVVDFFIVDEQIAVARHAELPCAFNRHPAEQLSDERRNDRREEHEVGHARSVGRWRQANDSRQRARHLHDRQLGIAPERVLTRQSHDEVQALVLDSRKRSSRVQPERRQHRLDFLGEIVGSQLRCCGVNVLAFTN